MKAWYATLVLIVLCVVPLHAGEWFVPAAAHVDGEQGSVWRSQLTLNNFGDRALDVTVSLLPRGADNLSLAEQRHLQLAAGETREIDDVLLTLFAFEGAAALKLDADGDAMVVGSRTYNQAATGTFGQEIPGVSREAGLAADGAAYLLGLGNSGGQRTNIGWVNMEAAAVSVSVKLFNADHQLLASASFPEKPHGHSQFNLFNQLYAQPVDDVVAVVESSGRLQPYASVVAAGSNDPIYVSALGAMDSGTELLFPASAHVLGAGGTSWLSDLWIVNLGSQPARLSFELWLQGSENATPDSVEWPQPLGVGCTLAVDDAVLQLFGRDNAQGAVVVRSDQQLLATSRTYNTADSGTFGQFIPAQRLSFMGGVGETMFLTGAVNTSAFRANLGLVGRGTSSEVELVLRAEDGQVLATRNKTLRSNEQFQQRVSSFFGVAEFNAATVELRLASSADGGGLAAYLSVVDEGTTDPTFIPAARGVGADPGDEEIAQVVTVVTTVLTGGVENSGPNTGLPKDESGCVSVDYSFDEVGPGESPVGKCWASTITYDECTWEFPNLGWAIAEDGYFAVDACVIDGYPSTLETDLTTATVNLLSSEEVVLRLEAMLALVLEYQGRQAESAHVTGNLAITSSGGWFDAWADLIWQANLTGLEPYPSGTLKLVFPYETAEASAQVEVNATFDGSEVVKVEVRVGYWRTTFYLNLRTGEISVP